MQYRVSKFPALAMLLTTLVAFGTPGQAEEQRPRPVISANAELAAKAIQLPKQFSLNTVASEPNLANAVAFCFDPAGRIFVAETYRVGKGIEDNRWHMDWLDDDLAARTVEDRRAYLQRRLGDRYQTFMEASEQVRLLEDRDRDGLYETSSVFSGDYKDAVDGTAAGVLWENGRLLFTCIPALWELRDTNDDGKADARRALSTGYGVHTAFYGHDLHGLIEGPDGKLYFSIGDRGLNVKTPQGTIENTASGAVLRCNPDGSDLELFATGLRNPQELAFNEFGDLFTVDNNSDSGDQARLVHVVEGMDAGWRMSLQYLEDRGPFNREKIWHPQNPEQPASIVPPLANISNGPSGLVYYPGTGLPPRYKGAFFLVDFLGGPATSGVREFHVEQAGATYRLKAYKPFISGVLATDCDFGPNGDLYILDWVEGWNGPGVARVHRVTSDDAETAKQRAKLQASMQQVPTSSVSALLAALQDENMRVRMAAQRRLVEQGRRVAKPLQVIASKADTPLQARLHAIWASGELAEKEPKLFDGICTLTEDKDAEVRAQAARTIGRAGRAAPAIQARCSASLVKLLGDSSPRVRSFAALSLAKLAEENCLAELLQVARQDGDDPTLRHAIAAALANTQLPETLKLAADRADDRQRLVLVVALGKQKSPLVADFLTDKNERVVLEAARLIWDTPIPAAQPQLAAMIENTKLHSDPLLRRVLAANFAGGSTQSLRRLIKFGCRAHVDPGLREIAWKHVRTWASPSPRDPVMGEWRPLGSRSNEELTTALKQSLPRLTEIAGSNPSGLIVAGELKISEAYRPLLEVVHSDYQKETDRTRAVAAFDQAEEGLVREAIEIGLASKSAAVRAAATTLWAARFPSEVVGRLAATIENGTLAERQSAVDTLANVGSPEANAVLREWMGRLENGTCPRELEIEVLEAAGKSKDADLADRQKRFVKGRGAGGPIVKFGQSLAGGDAANGRKIFETNDTLACRRCHSLKPGEILVGPSLASVGRERKPEEILESIVAPNVKIVEGFDSIVLQLDTGKVVTGIVRRETPSKIELVDADAKVIEVDPASVEDRVKGKSPMPEDLVKQMTPRQLRDIVAFLEELRSPPVSSAAVTNAAADR